MLNNKNDAFDRTFGGDRHTAAVHDVPSGRYRYLKAPGLTGEVRAGAPVGGGVIRHLFSNQKFYWMLF